MWFSIGCNSEFSGSRTLVRKAGAAQLEPSQRSLPPWFGPQYYENSDPPYLRARPDRSYQQAFRSTGRERDPTAGSDKGALAAAGNAAAKRGVGAGAGDAAFIASGTATADTISGALVKGGSSAVGGEVALSVEMSRRQSVSRNKQRVKALQATHGAEALAAAAVAATARQGIQAASGAGIGQSLSTIGEAAPMLGGYLDKSISTAAINTGSSNWDGGEEQLRGLASPSSRLRRASAAVLAIQRRKSCMHAGSLATQRGRRGGVSGRSGRSRGGGRGSGRGSDRAGASRADSAVSLASSGGMAGAGEGVPRRVRSRMMLRSRSKSTVLQSQPSTLLLTFDSDSDADSNSTELDSDWGQGDGDGDGDGDTTVGSAEGSDVSTNASSNASASGSPSEATSGGSSAPFGSQTSSRRHHHRRRHVRRPLHPFKSTDRAGGSSKNRSKSPDKIAKTKPGGLDSPGRTLNSQDWEKGAESPGRSGSAGERGKWRTHPFSRSLVTSGPFSNRSQSRGGGVSGGGRSALGAQLESALGAAGHSSHWHGLRMGSSLGNLTILGSVSKAVQGTPSMAGVSPPPTPTDIATATATGTSSSLPAIRTADRGGASKGNLVTFGPTSPLRGPAAPPNSSVSGASTSAGAAPISSSAGVETIAPFSRPGSKAAGSPGVLGVGSVEQPQQTSNGNNSNSNREVSKSRRKHAPPIIRAAVEQVPAHRCFGGGPQLSAVECHNEFAVRIRRQEEAIQARRFRAKDYTLGGAAASGAETSQDGAAAAGAGAGAIGGSAEELGAEWLLDQLEQPGLYQQQHKRRDSYTRYPQYGRLTSDIFNVKAPEYVPPKNNRHARSGANKVDAQGRARAGSTTTATAGPSASTNVSSTADAQASAVPPAPLLHHVSKQQSTFSLATSSTASAAAFGATSSADGSALSTSASTSAVPSADVGVLVVARSSSVIGLDDVEEVTTGAEAVILGIEEGPGEGVNDAGAGAGAGADLIQQPQQQSPLHRGYAEQLTPMTNLRPRTIENMLMRRDYSRDQSELASTTILAAANVRPLTPPGSAQSSRTASAGGTGGTGRGGAERGGAEAGSQPSSRRGTRRSVLAHHPEAEYEHEHEHGLQDADVATSAQPQGGAPPAAARSAEDIEETAEEAALHLDLSGPDLRLDRKLAAWYREHGVIRTTQRGAAQVNNTKMGSQGATFLAAQTQLQPIALSLTGLLLDSNPYQPDDDYIKDYFNKDAADIGK